MLQQQAPIPEQDSGPVEVVGIVHPRGSSGGKSGKSPLWSLHFEFVAWRIVGDAVEERQLSLREPDLDDAGLREMMGGIRPYDILRARVRFEPLREGAASVRGELVELLGKESSDGELNARLEELRRPVTVSHPFFGTFTLDRRFNLYEVDVAWGSDTVRLRIDRDDDEDESDLFANAQRLWEQQQAWDERIRDFAVDRLLELKNDEWLGEKEKKFTPGRFKKRMKLGSVQVRKGGHFEFTFDDGDLFWGHVIQVRGTLAGGPKHASIAG